MSRFGAMLRRRRQDEGGAVVLLVAVTSVLFFAIAALVVDLAQARVVRREAQAASDASALAGATALYLSGTPTANFTGAVAAVKSYAARNFGVTEADWDTCEDPAHLSHLPNTLQPCISFNREVEPSKVRVLMPTRRVAFAFTAAFGGPDDIAVNAVAEASLRVGGVSECGLCVLGSGTTHDVQNGDVEVAGGSIAINGNVRVKPNGFVSTSGSISVEGTADPDNGFDPPPLEGQPPIDDPLATYPLPSSFDAMPRKTNPCGAGKGPGVYGAFNFPGGTCTLDPGLYVITGQWSLAGTTHVDAISGVTLYFSCGTTSTPLACTSPGQAGGWLDATGGSSIKIAAPSTGATKGLAIAYDRLNTSQLRLTGNGASQYIGTIYAYSATLNYVGNADALANRSLIVLKSMTMSGNNARLESTYDPAVNVYVPPGELHLSK